MPFDGSGNYSLPAGSTAVTGATAIASTHNNPIQDIASALNSTLLRSGVAPMTGNLNANSNKIVGLAAGDSAGDAVRYEQSLAAIDDTDGNFVVGTGSGFTAESGATARTSLGLGSAAVKDTGTSGNTVPLLDGNNTHSGSLTVSGTFSATGTATLGDGSGDTVVIKGTTVSTFVAGILSAADAAAFRSAIGLGTIATQNSPLPLTAGGTGSGVAITGARNLLNAISTTPGAMIWRTTDWQDLGPP